MSGKSLDKILAEFLPGKESERTGEGLSPVLYRPEPGVKRAVYKVFRELKKKEDTATIERLKIRHDITVIYPQKIGRELAKTFGHYHPKNYPEIYEVLSGWAWWILQRARKGNPKVIEEIYLVEAKENEKVIMSPGFGHNMINPGKEELITSNWIGLFEYDYESYENLRGAAYYLLESRDAQSVDFEKNSYYDKVPEIIKLQPKEIPELGILKSVPLYHMIKTPENLEFLIKPEKYLELLTIENCYKHL